jgi:hypothetical protein
MAVSDIRARTPSQAISSARRSSSVSTGLNLRCSIAAGGFANLNELKPGICFQDGVYIGLAPCTVRILNRPTRPHQMVRPHSFQDYVKGYRSTEGQIRIRLDWSNCLKLGVSFHAEVQTRLEKSESQRSGIFPFRTHLLKRRTTSSSFILPCSALNISMTRWLFHVRCFSNNATNSATYCSSLFILAFQSNSVLLSSWLVTP